MAFLTCVMVTLLQLAELVNGSTSDASDSTEFEPRTFDGTDNNVDFPLWGSVGISQLRSLTESDYADDAFTPPGDTRPSAREVMTDVFLASSATGAEQSALFAAWGQLVSFDLFLNSDNASEPFDIACDDGGGLVDVWCPSGADSDPIAFDRSDATVSSSIRSPTNYATSYLDLDFVYGRSEEDAELLRELEDGKMTVSDAGIPVENADGTWLIADQRSAEFPVTFALHSMFLMEHNRCCDKVAPDLGFSGDEDIYQACRTWTIAVYQHIVENDWAIRLLGGLIFDQCALEAETVCSMSYTTLEDDDYRRRKLGVSEQEYALEEEEEEDNSNNEGQEEEETRSSKKQRIQRRLDDRDRVRRALEIMENNRVRRLYSESYYSDAVNAGADVFATTAGSMAFAAMLPPTLRIVDEGYDPMDEDNIELHVASADISGLFARNGIGPVLRGAVLSPVLAVDAHFATVVSNVSPLFKLPVDAVQRGRDHGLPTYNDARVAYGLTAATSFEGITDDSDIATLLDDSYGGDIDQVDAITGALAEGTNSSTAGVLGPLLQKAWLEQLFRSMAGDRLYHLHSRPIEDVEITTLQNVLNRTVSVGDLPLSVFTTPSVDVCGGDCSVVGDADVLLSDEFGVGWTVFDDDMLSITLRAKGIGLQGYMGIGWGGTTMATAEDYVICEVDTEYDEGAECTDRAFITSRAVPPLDADGGELTVDSVTVEGDWTMVTFFRPSGSTTEEDYDLQSDIDAGDVFTETIYSYREGAGIGQHPNANRGASEVNYFTGDSNQVCDEYQDFVALHGCLMLLAWMLFAPVGIYYARYRKGDEVIFGNQWYEMHEELMILTAEAVLPVAITAVFALEAQHNTSHARWGFYMIAAVAVQIGTGFLRVKALEAKQSNFSKLHRVNKYFHIWAGRFAYVAGVVQCYRGLELVSANDSLLFSAGDGLDLELGTFGFVQDKIFPAWLAIFIVLLIFFEVRKQIRRYSRKGAANVCGCVELINEDYKAEGEGADRLVPRTEDLPIYTTMEFNDKVLNGQSWVLVDGAILDVSEFAHRHPGGARLINNAVGTDVTHELLGEELSVGTVMSFNPHRHPQSAWEIVHSLVIGYIEEDDVDQEQDEQQQNVAVSNKGLARRLRHMAPSTALLPGNRNPSIQSSNIDHKARRLNSLANIPSMPSPKDGSDPNAGAKPEMAAVMRRLRSKLLMERFHVCPLLFRERMSPPGCSRPVYKYVFTCPGKAEILVQAIKGVGYFNLRVARAGKGVVQRAYNAFPVRVIQNGTPDSPASSGRRDSVGFQNFVPGGGIGDRKVVPASDTKEGTLCIEMRIRQYHDGAMSQLLEKLANDPDNPAVQLQGPFLIEKIIPPPAHRNVIMIAAGTGINPMVQLIRDYQALNRDATKSSKSRLSLLWQSTGESDLFCADELTAMQAKSSGLLEVTALVSGEHRKRNIPGLAFKKAKAGLKAAKNRMVSPASSSPNSSMLAMPPGRPPRSGDNTTTNSVGGVAPSSGTRGERKDQEGGRDDSEAALKASMTGTSLQFSGPKESKTPLRSARHGAVVDLADIDATGGGGLIRSKATREILDKVFGEVLVKNLESYRRSKIRRRKSLRREATRRSSKLKIHEEVTEESQDTDNNIHVDDEDLAHDMDELCGTDTTPGKLQVVVSGPAGFVFHVETILGDMGVPSEAMVLLD